MQTHLKPTVLDRPEGLKPKSFELVDGIDLTMREKDSLSRRFLLRWLKAKKYEKLKGLQNQLIEASYSERDELKEKIIENTKRELARHKMLSIAERERQAKAFAEELLSVAEGVGNVKLVLNKYRRYDNDLKAFNSVLNTYVGKGQRVGFMKRLGKSGLFMHAMKLIKRENPLLAKRIDRYMRDGDYEKMSQAIVDGTKHSAISISKEHIDQIVAMEVMGEAGHVKYTGWKTLDTAINWLDKARHTGTAYVLAKAANDLGVNKMLVFSLSKYSYKDLLSKNAILQRHRHLIVDKETKTPHEIDQLAFIDGLSKLVQHLNAKIAKHNVDQRFRESLKKYLSKQKNLTAKDKADIIGKANLQDLRVMHIFNEIYGSEEQRPKYWEYSLSRGPKMWTAFNTLFREHRQMRKALRRYHTSRIVEWADNMMSGNAKKWQLSGISNGLGQLENRLDKMGPKMDDLGKLRERAGKFDSKAEGALSDSMIEHDKIHRDYQAMVRRATRIMTQQAQGIIGVGRHLQTMQKSAGSKFLGTGLAALPYISDDSLRKLFPGKNITNAFRGSLKGGDLIRAYTNKLVDLKTMQDVTRARFASVANQIEESVAKPFATQYGEVLDKVDRQTMHANTNAELRKVGKGVQDIQQNLTPGRRMKRIGIKLALPAVIVGMQGYNLFTGKTKSKEALWELGEAALGFVPFVGTAMDIRGLVKGRSLSGRELNWKERAMYGVFAGVGVLADAATILGGWGLGLRAGLGGMRTARRSVKAGALMADARSTGKALDVAAYGATKDLPMLQRGLAGFANKFNKVRRADRASDAIFTAKAMEHARLLNKHEEFFRAAKIDISDITQLDKAAQYARRAGRLDVAEDIYKLKKLVHSSGVGIDYLKIAKAADKGHLLEIPQNFFGKVWFATKTKFAQIKGWLRGIGVGSDTLRNYERSFETLSAAKKSRETAVMALSTSTRLHAKNLDTYQLAYKQLFEQGSTLGIRQKRYASLVEEARRLRTDRVDASRIVKRLTSNHKDLIKKGAKKSRIDDAKRAMDQAKKKFDGVVSQSKTKLKEKGVLKKSLKTEKSGWVKQMDEADVKLWGIEKDMMSKRHAIRDAQEAMHSANSSRSILELEMMAKASNAQRRSQSLSGVAKTLQYGGLAMGAVWIFSGFRYGPAEQIRAVSPIAGKVKKYGGKVTDILFFEDHSGAPPLDALVGRQIAGIKYKKEMDNDLKKFVDKGEKPEVYLARHWNDSVARDLAKEYNVHEKAEALVNSGKVKVENQKLGGARQKVRQAKVSVKVALTRGKVALGNVSEKIKSKLS